MVKWKKQLKIDVLDAYGGVCVCCGEEEIAFLTIDHVDGGGNAHRREIEVKHGRGSVVFYAWLKREGWPGGYQVLCWNCNAAKAMVGQCPHQGGE